MSGILSVLLAIFKAVPAAKELWDKLVSIYIMSQAGKMKEENRQAIASALVEHDQRFIEQLIRSPRAGKESGYEGTEIRDTLPGVK